MMPKMNGLQVLDSLKQTRPPRPYGSNVDQFGRQQDAETLSVKALKYIVKSEHEPKEVADMVKNSAATPVTMSWPHTLITQFASRVCWKPNTRQTANESDY